MKVIKGLPYKLKKKFTKIENTYNFYSKLLKHNTELHFRDKLIYNEKEDIYVWNDKIIQVNAIDILDTLYDLIKADLVEKVSDKE